MQRFLEYTALPARYCAALADALLAADDTEPHGTAILAQLAASGLFVQALDDRQEWYRYHDLFRDLLRRRLTVRHSPAAVRALHAHTSAWFAERGEIDAALEDVALAANDAEGAARLVEQHIKEPLASDGWPRLERWLRLLPADLVRRRCRRSC